MSERERDETWCSPRGSGSAYCGGPGQPPACASCRRAPCRLPNQIHRYVHSFIYADMCIRRYIQIYLYTDRFIRTYMQISSYTDMLICKYIQIWTCIQICSFVTRHLCVHLVYRGTSLVRKRRHLGPYRRPMPGVLGGGLGGWAFTYGRGTPVWERR